MVNLSSPFSRLRCERVLVIGDLMLDTYTLGSVGRISPEAPVPVLNVLKEEYRAGGAGNVALCLVSMGMDVRILSRVGEDSPGDMLIAALLAHGIDDAAIVREKSYPTSVKNRIIAETQQIVRVDKEVLTPLSEQLEQLIINNLEIYLEGIEVVAISDYAKGFLSPCLLQEVILRACKKNIPVVVDPKGHDFSKYQGATLIKPNYSEALIASGLSASNSLEEMANKMLDDTLCEHLLITCSEKGMSLFSKKEGSKDFPAVVREVNDVTGAGDTVLAMLTCAIASDLSIEEAICLANIAAGISVEYMGCTHISLRQLAQRLLETDLTNKVFEEEHLFALQNVLENKQTIVLGVNAEEGLGIELFSHLHSFSQNKNSQLLIYIRDEEPVPVFVKMLASLSEVDYIILKSESLRHLCLKIIPAAVYVLEKGELTQRDYAEILLV